MHLVRAEQLIPELEMGMGGHLKHSTVRRWLWVLDLLVLSLSAALAAKLVSWVPTHGPAHTLTEDAAAVVLVLAVWLVLLAVNGEYRYRRWSFGIDEDHHIITASLEAFTLLALGMYLTDFHLPRAWVLIFFVTAVPSLIAGRCLARAFIHHVRRAGLGRERALLVGAPDAIARLSIVLQRERWLGLTPVGSLEADELDNHAGGALADIEAVVDAVADVRADLVMLCDGAFHVGSDFNALARRLEREDVHLVVVPALTDISPQRIAMVPAAGLPLVFVERPHAQRAVSRAKRAFDILVAGVALLIAAPVMAVAAVLIRREDGGPVIFRQTRIGRDGQPFDMLKLRSMVLDAEQLLAQNGLRSDTSDGVLFKMQDDPRITRVGRVIRRYSIDELPQLWNVLRGDMSIVGPRPALACEVAQYQPTVYRRLDVRPGITGLWQVSGRSDLSWTDAVRLDLYYVDNWSMAQDALILLRTARAVARPAGAY
jgi:exopolysaccharide biosynthesis polyprenyl glycosylphosphotransferase